MAVLRKSGFEDTIFVIVFILALSIFLLVIAKAWTDMRTPLEAGINDSFENTDHNVTRTFDSITSAISLTDKLMPLILIGIFAFLFIGVGSYMQHPIMIFVGIILLAVAVLLGVMFSNIYQGISESSQFSSTDMPISNIYMKYLPVIIVVIFIFVIGILIYTKGRGGSQAL